MRSLRRFLATMDARIRTRRGMNARMVTRRYATSRAMIQRKYSRQKRI